MNRSKYFRLFASVGIWLLIGLIFSGQLRLLGVANGYRMNWRDVFSWELTRWLLWIPFVPWIVRLSRRRPVYPAVNAPTILRHAGAAAGISLLHLALFTVLYWTVAGFEDAFAAHQPFWQAIYATLQTGIHKAPLDLFRIGRMIFILDFHIGILVYATILVGYQAMESSRHAADLKTRLAGARLDALKMQLHPHFLFNTLNSISALVRKNPDAADEMIGELGNFLRLTLENPDKHEIRLEEELNFLRSYLEIERVRLQERLTVRMNIDEVTLQAMVPNLILQPILENAIRHAISPRTMPGTIEVSARKADGRLHLAVSDDGPGLPAIPGKGIGLQNVRERLQQLYGADQALRLVTGSSGGLTVEIVVPFRVEERE